MLGKIALGFECGLIYYLIECLYRGHSDISMFVLVALLSVLCIDTPNNLWSFDLDLRLQVLISTILCTIGEGITGIIVNVILGKNIWDYSNLVGTFFFGQCNIFFCFTWAILVLFIGIPFCDAWNYYILKEDPCPYYKIRNKIVFRMKPR